MAKKGQKTSEETKQLIREARKKQVHPNMAARGYTLEMIEEEIRKGNLWCTGNCKSFISSSQFSTKNNSGRCKKCNAEYAYKVRRGTHLKKMSEEAAAGIRRRKESPEYSRLWDRMKKYGATPEWYEKQFESQGGHCALCPATASHVGSKPRLLYVDHCHATGAIRGLLCVRCNGHLGIMEKDPGWHDRALDYLTRKFPEAF